MLRIERGALVSRREFVNMAFVMGTAAFHTPRICTRREALPVRIDIFRQFVNEVCTSGYLAVDGETICHALELPNADNVQYISSIPAGEYDTTLRYDKADHWRLQLKKVPGRTGVQIHIANEPDELQGCIAVGLSLQDDLCGLIDSDKAYSALKQAIYGPENVSVPAPPFDITVAIHDQS